MTSKIAQSKSVKLFVFRHGETDWNRDRRFQGHTDIALNDTGRAQAASLAKTLQDYKLDVILSSDLLRAKETTDIVNQTLNLPVFISSALRECRLGDPEGKLRDSIVQDYGAETWSRWLSVNPDDHHFGFPNGETKNDHLQRLINFIEPFIKSHPEFSRIGISTHGGSVRRLAHYSLNAPAQAIALPNCALYELELNRLNCEWQFVRQLNTDPEQTAEDSNVWGEGT